MRCLVCDNEIRINCLKQLFSFQPLRICSRCSVNLIPSVEVGILFQRNEWMESVIDKLNQGDLVLIELFKNELLKQLSCKEWKNYRVEAANLDKEIPYPWLEILVQQVKKDTKEEVLVSVADVLVITVVKEKNVKNQIGIFEKI